jgi:hypothetical protein
VDAEQHLALSLEPLDDYVVVEPVDEETETRTGLIWRRRSFAEAS